MGNRYGILAFYFVNNAPVFKWAGSDLSYSSARDAVKAWEYQAGQKGGYMEIIEDSQAAFDEKKAEIIKFHPRINEDGSDNV